MLEKLMVWYSIDKDRYKGESNKYELFRNRKCTYIFIFLLCQLDQVFALFPCKLYVVPLHDVAQADLCLHRVPVH